MKYSFVLPAFKAKYFRDAINSILRQKYQDFELIIVNDASPEDLDTIVESYSDDRIKYYKNPENIGGRDLVKHWNYCISLCNSEYVILASDDDIYDPDYLLEMDRLVQKYPQVNVFKSRVQYINELGELIGIDGYINEFNTQIEFVHSWLRVWIGSGIPFYLFKRSHLLKMGGFIHYPMAWFSDDATVFNLISDGIASSSKVLFSFRMSGHNISSKKNSKKVLVSKILATDKFYHYVKGLISSYQCSNEYEKLLQTEISIILPVFIQKNKLYGQLFNSSLDVILSVLPRICKLEYVKVRDFVKYFLLFLLGKK